jgi:transposase
MEVIPDKQIDQYMIGDDVWQKLWPILVKIRNTQGPKHRMSDRAFLSAVIYLVRTGKPLRNLPPEVGDWESVYMRFRRWESSGTWKMLFLELKLAGCHDIIRLFVANERCVQPSCNDGARTKYVHMSQRLLKLLRQAFEVP